ncbi:MAG: RNA methyltransferase, partial [Deltaproteobacteria bacterium]|nr:RNA methyltransferase [Deltaproteobacteria bacterium]
AGVALSERDASSPRLLGGPPRLIVGAPALERRVQPGGPVDLVALGGFAQVHAGVERAVHEAIVREVEPRPGRVVIEAFAGAGALSLELARRGARVLSVESFEPAVRLAREAARSQSLPLEATAGDAARFLSDAAKRGERPHALIVNPPRRGLSPGLRADAAALSPRRIVYLSCEPRTLARDLADLAVKGYRPQSLQPFDMIPLTAEVETLAVLARDELPPPELLHEGESLLAVVKPPHEPTTPQGEHQGSLLARVRALPGASAAVPVHRLDVGTSGVCLFAREPGAVAVIARALAEGEKEYVALLRGVTRDRGVVNRPLLEQGRTVAARTRYVRRHVVAGHSLVSVLPDQGRRHQIRRHFAAIGYPVVGDQRHGHPPTNAHLEARAFLDRPFLHCARIELPLAGGAVSLEARLAPDLAAVLDALGAAWERVALPD